MAGKGRKGMIAPEAKELLALVAKCRDIDLLRAVATRVITDVGFRHYVADGGLEVEGIKESIQKLKEAS